MSPIPQISVIIPTKNRVDRLKSAMESVLNQTLSDLELFIVDDSAEGNAFELVQTMIEKDSRIRYFRNEGCGANAARNLGIKEAKGEIIAFNDDDDIFREDKLQKQLHYLRTNRLDLVYCYSKRIVTRNGALVDDSIYAPPCPSNRLMHPYLLAYSFIVTASIVCRKDAIERIGGFDESLASCTDWDLVIHLAINGCRFGCVKEPLVEIDSSDGQRVSNLKVENLDTIIRKYRDHYRAPLPLLVYLAYSAKSGQWGRLKSYLRSAVF